MKKIEQETLVARCKALIEDAYDGGVLIDGLWENCSIAEDIDSIKDFIENLK